MGMETVSVIVPVYGVEQYLDRCVQSILAQTDRDIEVILVDDGSKDRSGEICDAYGAKDARVRVLHKENGGLMSAWMAGVGISAGRYLCFVDSDDWIEPDMIEALRGALSVDPSVQGGQIVCCNCLTDHGDGGEPDKSTHAAAPGIYEGDILTNEIKENIAGRARRTVEMSRCMKLISRELIDANLHYCNTKIHMGEDMNIMLPALLDCKRLVILPDHYDYHYFFNPGSIAHKYNPGLYENVKLLGEVTLQVLRDKSAQMPGKSDDALRDMATREFLFLFFLVLKSEIRRTDIPAKDVVKNVKVLCKKENTKEKMRLVTERIKDPAGLLMATICRHPNSAVINAVRLIFRIKD